MCPRLPDKPATCTTDEPDLWRDGDTEDGCCCPLLLVPKFDYEIKAYGMFKHNITPTGIGWENESYLWNQAMETIDNITNRIQSEAMDAVKKR